MIAMELYWLKHEVFAGRASDIAINVLLPTSRATSVYIDFFHYFKV